MPERLEQSSICATSSSEKSDWDGKDVYGWWSGEGKIEEPTHWMPMPTAPETEGKSNA